MPLLRRLLNGQPFEMIFQSMCGPIGILSGSRARMGRFGSAIAGIGDIDRNGYQGNAFKLFPGFDVI